MVVKSVAFRPMSINPRGRSCPRLRAVPPIKAQAAPRMTHVALHVKDLESSRRFYEEFCGIKVYHEHGRSDHKTLWLAEPGLENQFAYVMFEGSKVEPQVQGDFSHLGFSVESREAVDAIAEKAKEQEILAFGPKGMPYPVGYICMVKDPDGRLVEFSFGQPIAGLSDGRLIKV